LFLSLVSEGEGRRRGNGSKEKGKKKPFAVLLSYPIIAWQF
jgi:hypothetical protein